MIYSFNEGNYSGWSDGLRSYIDSLKDPSKWGGKPYSSRCAPRGAVHVHAVWSIGVEGLP